MAAREIPAGGIFAFPLRVGAIDLGPIRVGVVHQATGMILAQVGTTAAGAFALRARSFFEGRPVRQVAREVIARRLSFADSN